MQLSLVLLIALFILCCTRNMDGILARFDFQTGHIAALAVLLMALSAFDFALGAGFSLHPACLLALVLSCISLRNEQEVYALPLVAFLAGLGGWLLARGFPQATELGLLVALPAAVLSRVCFKRPRVGLCMLLVAPLFYEFCVMLEDWYLFGFASMGLGDALQFDAQIAGALLYGALLLVPRLKRAATPQKEA